MEPVGAVGGAGHTIIQHLRQGERADGKGAHQVMGDSEMSNHRKKSGGLMLTSLGGVLIAILLFLLTGDAGGWREF